MKTKQRNYELSALNFFGGQYVAISKISTSDQMKLKVS